MRLVKRENFFAVFGWMITDLGLKGVKRDVYAIIYGFSQTEDQMFTGSHKYLAEWTGSSKSTVKRAIKELMEDGLIEKTESYKNGVMFCYYSANGGWGQNEPPQSKMTRGGVKMNPGGGVKMNPNNIDIQNIDIQKSYPPKSPPRGSEPAPPKKATQGKREVTEVIDYLNARLGTKYKATTKATAQLINARLAEGFTVEDFKTVIDKKIADWTGTKYAAYLKPGTLFSPSKFEGYLNQQRLSRDMTFGEVFEEKGASYGFGSSKGTLERSFSNLPKRLPVDE